MSITIKHKTTKQIINEVDAETLCNADLRSADLRSADLCDADLHNADLRGAKITILQIGYIIDALQIVIIEK